MLYGVNPETGGQLHPDVVAFFIEQGAQPPLALDVGWLTVRHVDEMSSFLPATDGGFFVAVPDPTTAIDLLESAATRGHGDAAMLTPYEQGTTVQSILDDAEFLAFSRRLWAERIEPMSRVLLEGIGVASGGMEGRPTLEYISSNSPLRPSRASSTISRIVRSG